MIGRKGTNSCAGRIITVHTAAGYKNCFFPTSPIDFGFMYVNKIIRCQTIEHFAFFRPVFNGFSGPGQGNRIRHLRYPVFVDRFAGADAGGNFPVRATIAKTQINKCGQSFFRSAQNFFRQPDAGNNCCSRRYF